MTRAKDISKIVTDADLSGTLDVTGTVTAGGLTVDAAIPTLQLNDTDGTNQFGKMRQAGPNLLVTSRDNTSNGGFRIAGDNGTSETNRFNIASNGDISFYEDTGTTAKFFWDASAERLGIGTTSPGSNIEIEDTSSNVVLRMVSSATSQSAIYLGDANFRSRARLIYDNSDETFQIWGADGVSSAQRITLNSSGNVGIGTSSPTVLDAGATGLHLHGDTRAQFHLTSSTTGTAGTDGMYLNYDGANGSISMRENQNLIFDTNATERMRINSSGDLLVGTTTSLSSSVEGIILTAQGDIEAYRDTNRAALFGRNGNDGTIVAFAQADTVEGTISVSGTTVSYNGGHLSRWSRLLDNSKDTTIVKGTVMTNLDEMVEWGDEDNEQLNKMAVSSVEGDANVAGVFVNWDEDDDWNDMNIAMTGDMVIRIAQGTTVARGDLLMSAGDGTAKPQGDDIVRSKTIAKVTSTNVSHTYDDGTYLVPCVLMAC